MKKNYTSHIVTGIICLVLGFWIASAMTHTPGHSTHHAWWVHDPMQMSMADMWAMLQWQTGDDLDRAFLEWMIPHHQWAIDMAEFLVDAKHPELQQLWRDIIVAQQAEIDQMEKWLVEWGYKN